MDGLPGVGQSQTEQCAGQQLDDDFAEVDLGLTAREVSPWDERVDGLPPGLDADLASTSRVVVAT